MDYCENCENILCICALEDPKYAHLWDFRASLIRIELDEYEEYIENLMRGQGI